MSLSKRSLKIIGIVGGVVLIISIVALLIGRSNQTTSPPLLETSQQLTKSQDNIVTLDDGLRVELPAGSIFEESDMLTIASYQNPPHGNQESIKFVGNFYDINLASGEFFNGISKLEIPYDETSIPPGYTEDEVFAVYSTEGEWYRLYGDVNSEENIITVYTIHNGFWSTAIDRVSNFIGDVADFFSGRTSDYSDIEAARENVRIKRTEFLQTVAALETAGAEAESDIGGWAIKSLWETAVIHGLKTAVVEYAGTTVLAGKIVVAGATVGTWVTLVGGTLILMDMAEETGEIMALRIRLEIALDRLQEAEAILWVLEHPEVQTLSPSHQKALEDYIAALPIDQTISITTPVDFNVSAYPYPEEASSKFSLTISSTAGGSVTTPGEGTFAYDTGAVVSLVANPNSGYRFVNWTGDTGTLTDVNAASTIITMNGDYSITASFAGEEETVDFPDFNLEAAIREAIGKPTGDIYASDLEGLTSLDAMEMNITDLTGLEHATSLISLNLWDNQISDTSPLTNLTSLKDLALLENQISDISPLANITSLTILSLAKNQISDISPLANITSLTILSLAKNQISDISPLTNLTNLTFLNLTLNQISDIQPLVNLTSLDVLYIDHNQISDIEPLVMNPGLSTGDQIYLWNPLSDDSINIYIPQLEARGVTVYYK
jgi:hypothetical protein